MPSYKKIKFFIDGYTPDTLPIGRLAEYLKQFSALVGTDADVHFEKVGKGSAALISKAREEIVPEVRGRIVGARQGTAAPEAVRADAAIRNLLYQDKTTGRIKEGRAKILDFPKPDMPQYGPVAEEGSLEGVIIRIGGRDETIHIHIEDGEKYYKCVTTRAKAKELRNFLFDVPVRVFGRGKWTRTYTGTWELSEFRITDHEPLNSDEIQQVLDRMRQVHGSGWDKINDPLGELNKIRKGSGKVQ